MGTKSEMLCELLTWDSEFFGFPIARLAANRLSFDIVSGSLTWCRQNRIRCLYFLADIDDPMTTGLASQHGFKWVDIRMTFEKQIDPQRIVTHFPQMVNIRQAKIADSLTLKTIAKSSFQDSRFYYDLNFSRTACDALYDTWIEKSLNGYADAVLVMESQDDLLGFITCHLHENQGQIGLVSLAPDSRGRGLGKILIQAAESWFNNSGASNIVVVTQGRNIGAQRLYQKNGFLTQSMHLWYHRWFESESL